MKRLTVLLFVALIAAPLLQADFQEVLAEADRLYKQDEYEQSRAFLEASLGEAAGGQEQSQLYWRLARTWLDLGDQAEDKGVKGEALLAFFAKGEELAQKGIELDPEDYLAYYWKCANIGRWGQVKGIFNALGKAKPMRDLLQKTLSIRPDHSDSYYVLGQLYEQVPGAPLSFGDKDWAVSLGRKSVDLRAEQVSSGQEEELNYDFYTELGKHLRDRNWSAARRLKEQKKKEAPYAAKTDPMEKNFYYEVAVTLKDVSDRQEALELVSWAAQQLQDLPQRTRSQKDDLKEAQELLAAWKK
jgi:tetratricopeptide (TPR) repeat protein